MPAGEPIDRSRQGNTVSRSKTSQPADPIVAELAGEIMSQIRVFPDFPSSGVLFQDLCPILAQPQLLRRLADAIAARFATGFDVVLAVEARGFVLGTAVAQAAAAPLVLARKPGKLPGPVHSVDYTLEYGSTTLEMQHGAFGAGARVLVVDDVLATGGTLLAGRELVRQGGGELAGYAVLLTIAGLGGTSRLAPVEVFSIATAAGD